MEVSVLNRIFEINSTVTVVWNTRETGDIYYSPPEAQMNGVTFYFAVSQPQVTATGHSNVTAV